MLTPDLDATEPLRRLGAGNPVLEAMVREAVADGTPLMLLHIDIEHFASINQNMGIEVGDAALRIVGQRLRSAVAGRGHVWRHGSDEFVVAMTLDGNGRSARHASQGLIALIEQPLSILPYTLMLTAKAGISLCPEHGTAPDELLQWAESSMLRASREVHEPVQVHARADPEPPMGERVISP